MVGLTGAAVFGVGMVLVLLDHQSDTRMESRRRVSRARATRGEHLGGAEGQTTTAGPGGYRL